MNFDSLPYQYDYTEHLKEQKVEKLIIRVLKIEKQRDGILFIGKEINSKVIVTIIDNRSKDKIHYSFNNEILKFKQGDLITGKFQFCNDIKRYNTVIAKSRLSISFEKEEKSVSILDMILPIHTKKPLISFNEILQIIKNDRICGSFLVKFTGTQINSRGQIKLGDLFVNLHYKNIKSDIGKYFAGEVVICIKGYKNNFPIIIGYLYKTKYIDYHIHKNSPKDMYDFIIPDDPSNDDYCDDEFDCYDSYNEEFSMEEETPEGFCPWENEDEWEYAGEYAEDYMTDEFGRSRY